MRWIRECLGDERDQHVIRGSNIARMMSATTDIARAQGWREMSDPGAEG